MNGRDCFLAALHFALCVFSVAAARADLIGYWPLDTAAGRVTPNLAALPPHA